jgi:hypothetical protein|tara:strand:- start:1514 stop:2062 length:549 start_codon:yes stop_codon:yes gene_type:complete
MTTRNYSQGVYNANVYGEWAAIDAYATITASSSLSIVNRIPVDTYSSGEYGYGNYSAGTYRDASVTITTASAVAISNNVRIRNVSAVSTSSSTVTCVAQRIHGALIPTTGTSSVSVVGNVTFSGNPFPINGVSTVTVHPNRILFITINPISAASSTNFSARLKWVDEPITATNWTTVYKVAA